VGLVFLFSFLMILSAYVRIPLFFTPVPLTLQTLVLYLSLIFLKDRAPLSQLLYVGLGLAGFPVFANGGAGLLYLWGPTGGYIAGFVVVSCLFGYLFPKRPSVAGAVIFFSAAALGVYAFGLAHLVFFHGFSLQGALLAGLYPFVPGALIKISTASAFAARHK
jgi:biotin transport system substrate-specific component